jgi:hypothetical protein
MKRTENATNWNDVSTRCLPLFKNSSPIWQPCLKRDCMQHRSVQ